MIKANHFGKNKDFQHKYHSLTHWSWGYFSSFLLSSGLPFGLSLFGLTTYNTSWYFKNFMIYFSKFWEFGLLYFLGPGNPGYHWIGLCWCNHEIWGDACCSYWRKKVIWSDLQHKGKCNAPLPNLILTKCWNQIVFRLIAFKISQKCHLFLLWLHFKKARIIWN